jgi:quercetin dioxygenase-like cupin family protein
MHLSSNQWTYPTCIHEALILTMLPEALSNVPFHHDTPCITRFTAKSFPLHLGVHQVSPVSTPPPQYTEPHIHEEYHEVNLIISEQELVYHIQLGNEVYTISNNACIWIPKGTVHAANLVRGSGYYIAMRIG